jgi:hypothetical protein
MHTEVATGTAGDAQCVQPITHSTRLQVATGAAQRADELDSTLEDGEPIALQNTVRALVNDCVTSLDES